jgi:hopanoid biosynthesis associated protein HpnK
VTADDFGMSLEVNEAVELAHREGVLTCASLVVAGDAAPDAIRRARRMPNLGVGLHLALFGAPAACRAPSPIAPDGSDLGQSPLSTGAAIMLSRRVRAAAAREIAAQFEAYRKSGLSLGHLDGHWHCHEHPAVLAMALEQGKSLGLRAVRIPYEPYSFSRDIADGRLGPWRLPHAVSHGPLALAMRWRVRNAGLAANDRFFGKNDAGAIDEALLARLIQRLPVGVTELGLHPSVKGWSGPHAPPPHWRPESELAALISPAITSAIADNDVELCRWADLR